MNKLITITTDLGDQFAAAQLKAVIASLKFKCDLIENHSVTPFSIIEGAFQIKLLTKFCPNNTVHVGIVDPGVGSNRRGIIIKTKRSYLVGPDNGLLYLTGIEEGIRGAWKLQEKKISSYVSNTFHGRDVFIKIAVFLAQGKKPEQFSTQIKPSSLIKISLKKGQVLHIDHYGNIKIHWPKLLGYSTKILVKTKQKQLIVPVVRTFSDVPPKKPLVLVGSSGTLELALNLGRADIYYNVKVGEVIHINQRSL